MNLTLHHVGIVVDTIPKHRDFYVNSLGYCEQTGVIHDPLQSAYIQFFMVPGADHYLELVAPDGPESKLWNASRRRQPLNHLGYLVADLEAACDELIARGGRQLQAPVPAIAFDLRRIAWVIVLPDRLLLELIEKSGRTSGEYGMPCGLNLR